MANLNEVGTYDEGVYRLETTDPVQGGENGASNKPLKNLANRTTWLKAAIDAINTAITGIGTVLDGLKTASVKDATIDPVDGNVALWDNLYTKSQIDALIAAISGITLASGINAIGDVPPGGVSVTVSIGKTLPSANYRILGSILCEGSNPQNDTVNIWSVESQSTTQFVLRFQETANATSNISFDWKIESR